MVGTQSLRHSKDTYNPSRCLSIVIQSKLCTKKFDTLDLEVDNDELYGVLLQGFLILHGGIYLIMLLN
jgi:hypothetical protein